MATVEMSPLRWIHGFIAIHGSTPQCIALRIGGRRVSTPGVIEINPGLRRKGYIYTVMYVHIYIYTVIYIHTVIYIYIAVMYTYTYPFKEQLVWWTWWGYFMGTLKNYDYNYNMIWVCRCVWKWGILRIIAICSCLLMEDDDKPLDFCISLDRSSRCHSRFCSTVEIQVINSSHWGC